MRISQILLSAALGILPAVAGAAPYPTTGVGFPGGSAANWQANVSNGTGIPGGIPTDRTTIIDMTAAPYNCDPTDTNDCSGAILAAEATYSYHSPAVVLYFPAGTYKVAYFGRIQVGGFTIRGAGDSTVFDCHASGGGAGLGFGFTEAHGTHGNHTAITGGMNQGSTSITVADATNFAVGTTAQISENNDLSIPIFRVSGQEKGAGDGSTAGDRQQLVLITGKAGNTLTLSTPVMWTLISGLNPQLGSLYNTYNAFAHDIGLENFKLDMTNATVGVGIDFDECWNCWMTGVHVYNTKAYHVELNNDFQIQIDHCWLDTLNHVGSNGAGLDMAYCSNCLVQNNVINAAQPLIELNLGCSGNVFGYNLLYDTTTNGWCGPGISTHDPCCAFDLYEGNITPNFQSDGYEGTEDVNLTVFRNWLEGADPGNGTYVGAARQAVLLNRFTRGALVLGNLLGTHGIAWPNGSRGTNNSGAYLFGLPNIGNTSFNGSASLSQGSPWADWGMTGTVVSGPGATTGTILVTSGTIGDWATNFNGAGPNQAFLGGLGIVSANLSSGLVESVTVKYGNLPPLGTAVAMFAGTNGYQEQDLDVYTSSTVGANWDVPSNALPPQENFSTSAYTVPASLYLTSKPAWFGSLAWPAFDTATPTANVISGSTSAGYPAAFQNIPAGLRFVTGADPGEAPSFTTQPAPVFIFAEATATFTVVAQGSPAPTLQWQVSIDGDTWTPLNNGAPYFNVTTSALTIKKTPAYFNNYQFRCAATNAQGTATSTSAPLRITPRTAFQSIYFGAFAKGGNWALAVQSDNSGVFIADFGGNPITQNVMINADGSFDISSTNPAPLTSAETQLFSTGAPFAISAQISHGLVTGNAGSSELSGAQDTGDTKIGFAGFYSGAALLGSSGLSYAIIGGDGQVFVLASNGVSAGESCGMLNTDGSYNAETADGGAISFAINALGQAAVTLSPADSIKTESFLGLASTVEATSRVTNLSARGNSIAGTNPLTVGFVTSGGSKSILIRGIGPSLAEFGLSNPLNDPQLLLFQGTNTIQSNRGWGGGAALINAFDQAGAFALPTDSSDAALLTSLPAGTYTTQVASGSDASGIALAEIYDADTNVSPAGRLVNLSARAEVGTGGDVLVAGFIISGNTPETVLIRGVGPGLAKFGINNFLANPQLALFNANGTQLALNTGWGGTAALNKTFGQVGAFSLASNSNDAALMGVLAPGAYSAQVSGLNGSAGVALIEVFEVQ